MSTPTSTPRPASVLRSSSTSLILLGVLAVIVGIIAIAWPQVTIYALVILFAVYAFIDAALQAMRAFSSRTAGPVLGHLLLALIALAAGVIALVWPGPTALVLVLVLVLVVGIWAFVGGVFEIFAAFQRGETAGTRALFIITGLVSILFGVVLFADPNIGAVTLALLFGLFALIYGFSQITMGIETAPGQQDRGLGHKPRSLSRGCQPPPSMVVVDRDRVRRRQTGPITAAAKRARW